MRTPILFRGLRHSSITVILIDGLETRKVQYNSLTILLSSFMQEFGPISSRVYCIFAQITNNKFVVELSIRNLNKCSTDLNIAIGCAGKNTIHT